MTARSSWLQWRLAALGLALLLVATACSPFDRSSHPDAEIAGCLKSIAPPAEVTGLFVEPDDGIEPVIRELDAASCTIDLAVYILTDDHIVTALLAAESRGVRVRVMLEEHPFGGGGSQGEIKTRLESGGVDVRWSGSEIRFSHAKYAVIDSRVAFVMNLNLTAAAFRSNREFGITTTDPAIAAQAQELFDRDWVGQSIADLEGPLIVSPTNSRPHMLELINSANRRIDLYAEVIRDREIIAALGAAEARGVEVRLILDISMDEDTQAVAVELFDLGVEIRIADTLYIHAKLMVIDDESAVVGSQNFTATSLNHNRELAMVVSDPQILERCNSVFERDWLRASPGAPM